MRTMNGGFCRSELRENFRRVEADKNLFLSNVCPLVNAYFSEPARILVRYILAPILLARVMPDSGPNRRSRRLPRRPKRQQSKSVLFARLVPFMNADNHWSCSKIYAALALYESHSVNPK
jgi:hypothetical protein